MAHSEPVYLNSSTNATTLVGAAIVNVWNFSSRGMSAIANTAKKTYEDRQYKNTLPLLNAMSSHACRVLPRLLTPYPFKSVVSIVNFMVNETIRQTDFEKPPKPDQLESFMNDGIYEEAFGIFRFKFIEKIEEWKAEISLDINKAENARDNALLEALHHSFQFLEDELFSVRINSVLKPFFDRTFQLSQTSIVTHELTAIAQIAIGKLILQPQQRLYKDYLSDLVETAIRNLASSDCAMRRIGKGYFRAGLDRLYNKTTDAARLVSVYAVVLELADSPSKDLYQKVREEKIVRARELVLPNINAVDNHGDPLLAVTLDLLEIIEGPPDQKQFRPPLATHVEELANDLVMDDGILSLPIFQLCSKTQTIDMVNLFDETYKLSLKYIPSV